LAILAAMGVEVGAKLVASRAGTAARVLAWRRAREAGTVAA
jgi:hypothetical protein